MGMSKINTHQISRLRIDTGAYAQRFPRKAHFIGWLMDRNKPYFHEGERLTTVNLSEIENWPDTVNELFIGGDRKRAKDQFLLCSRGAIEPHTSTERIVAILIHQALAMGGLHGRIDEGNRGVPQIPKDQPSNDIDTLKILPLRSFLLGIEREMSKRKEEEWRANFLEAKLSAAEKLSVIKSEYYPTADELNEAHEAAQEWQTEVREIISSDSDNYARSAEEGWFYPDEDQ
jgi:hypothetical protein